MRLIVCVVITIHCMCWLVWFSMFEAWWFSNASLNLMFEITEQYPFLYLYMYVWIDLLLLVSGEYSVCVMHHHDILFRFNYNCSLLLWSCFWRSRLKLKSWCKVSLALPLRFITALLYCCCGMWLLLICTGQWQSWFAWSRIHLLASSFNRSWSSQGKYSCTCTVYVLSIYALIDLTCYCHKNCCT